MSLGIVGTNAPSGYMIASIVETIRLNHARLTIKELKLAFDMASAFKLNFDPKTYQNFSPLYVNELLQAYKKWSSEAYKMLRPQGDQEAEQEKSDWTYRIYERLPNDQIRADIQEGYHNYRTGILTQYLYIPYEWWGVLVEDGYIEYDENATVYENVQVSKLDADQKRKLKNGQQMVWLLFNMAHQQGREKLYIADNN